MAPSSSGNFIADAISGDNDVSIANDLGKGKSSTTTEYGAGTYHLEVNSECSWSIQVSQ